MLTSLLNPDSVSQKEKLFAEELESFWQELLNELKANGYIKKRFKPYKVDRVLKIIEMQDRIGVSFNSLTSLFEPNQKVPDEFFQATAKYGLTKETIPYLYFAMLYGKYLMETEQMKASLLMILKPKEPIREDLTLGQLMDAIKSKKVAPKNGQKLIELKMPNKEDILIDVELRNAVAHGLFWFENKEVHYCPKPEHKPKQISLGKFLLKTKAQNIATKTLIGIIAHNVRQGFFKK